MAGGPAEAPSSGLRALPRGAPLGPAHPRATPTSNTWLRPPSAGSRPLFPASGPAHRRARPRPLSHPWLRPTCVPGLAHAPPRPGGAPALLLTPEAELSPPSRTGNQTFSVERSCDPTQSSRPALSLSRPGNRAEPPLPLLGASSSCCVFSRAHYLVVFAARPAGAACRRRQAAGCRAGLACALPGPAARRRDPTPLTRGAGHGPLPSALSPGGLERAPERPCPFLHGLRGCPHVCSFVCFNGVTSVPARWNTLRTFQRSGGRGWGPGPA